MSPSINTAHAVNRMNTNRNQWVLSEKALDTPKVVPIKRRNSKLRKKNSPKLLRTLTKKMTNALRSMPWR